MKFKYILLSVFLALMSVLIGHAQEKKIAILVPDPLIGVQTYTQESDDRFMQAFAGYDVTKVTALASAPANIAEQFAEYDLIVAHPVLGGTQVNLMALRSLVGEKPILNLKAYCYADGRWGWSTQANAITANVRHVKVPVELKNHPVFQTLQFSGEADDELMMYNSDATLANSNFQYVGFPFSGTNWTNENSGWNVFNHRLAIYSTNENYAQMHEILNPEKPEAKYIMIGISTEGSNFEKLHDNAIQLLKNSIAYLLDPTAAYEYSQTVTYPVTVVGGTTANDEYLAGVTVTITAGTAPEGQQFKNWTAEPEVVFANANGATTTFTMPASAVTVTATFVDIPPPFCDGDYMIDFSGSPVRAAATVPGGSNLGQNTESVSVGGEVVGYLARAAVGAITTIFENDGTDTYLRHVRGTTTPPNPNSSTGNNQRPFYFILPDFIEFAEQLNAEFDIRLPTGVNMSSLRDYSISFLTSWPAGATTTTDGNDVLFTLSIPSAGTGNFTLKLALPQLPITTTGNNGNGPGGTDFTSTTAEDYVKSISEMKRDTWYSVKVNINTKDENVEFSINERGETEGATIVTIPLPDYYLKVYGQKRVRMILFNDAHSATNHYDIHFTKLCITSDGVENDKFAVTVVGGEGATGAGEYAEGAIVSITAGTAPAGQRFKNWTAEPEVVFANANNAATTFTMPANAVTVTANFEALLINTVTVVGGTAGASEYAEGATVPITAGTAPAGQRFKNWTAEPEVVFANANSATTTFTMPASAVTVTANFEAIPDEPNGCDFFEDFENATFTVTSANQHAEIKRNDDLIAKVTRGGTASLPVSLKDGYLYYEGSGGGQRAIWYMPVLPESEPVSFKKKMTVEFDLNTSNFEGGSGENCTGQIWFFGNDNSEVVNNHSLFTMFVFDGRSANAGKLGVALNPTVDLGTGSNGVGGNLNSLDRFESIDEQYRGIFELGGLRNQWIHVKVEINKPSQIVFTITDEEGKTEKLSFPVPDYYEASSWAAVYINGNRSGGNNLNWNVGLDNICVTVGDPKPIPPAYCMDFEGVRFVAAGQNDYTAQNLGQNASNLFRDDQLVGIGARAGQAAMQLSIQADGDDSYMRFDKPSGNNSRYTYFVLPETIEFEKEISIEFDFRTATNTQSNEANISFLANLPSNVGVGGKANDALFLIDVPEGSEDFPLSVALPFVTQAQSASGNGYGPSTGEYFRGTDPANIKTIDGMKRNTWYSVKVKVNETKRTVDFSIIERGVEGEPSTVSMVMPNYYAAKSVRMILFNQNQRTSNSAWQCDIDNICINVLDVPPIYADCEDFENPAELIGTLGAQPGNTTYNVAEDGYLQFNVAGGSGGRSAPFTLNEKVEFTKKLFVNFDWWTGAHAGGTTENEGQVQFRGGNDVLFTVYHQRIAAETPIGVTVGALGDGGRAGNVDEKYRKFIDAQVSTWYRVNVELTVGLNVKFTITGEDFESKFELPFPEGFSVASFDNILFNGTRIGGNFWWETRLDNLCITVPAEEDGGNVTLTFNAQGGVVSPESKEVEPYAEVGELPTPVREGFRFEGWFTEPEGKGTKYTAETRYVAEIDFTLYAKWLDLDDVFTISFDAQAEGVENPEVQEGITGREIGSMPVVRKPGYRLAGWFTEENGEGRQVSGSTVFDFGKDITLYAYWVEIGDWDYFADFDDTENPAGQAQDKVASNGGTGMNLHYYDVSLVEENNYVFRFANGGSGHRGGRFALPDTIPFEKKLLIEFDFSTTTSGAQEGNNEGIVYFLDEYNNMLFSMFVGGGNNSNTPLGFAAGMPVYGTDTLYRSTGEDRAYYPPNSANSRRWFGIPGQYKSRLDTAFRYTAGNQNSWGGENLFINWYHLKAEIIAETKQAYFTVTGITKPGFEDKLYLQLPDDFSATNITSIVFTTMYGGSNPDWAFQMDNLGIKADNDDPIPAMKLLSFDKNLPSGASDFNDIVEPRSKIVVAGQPVGELLNPYRWTTVDGERVAVDRRGYAEVFSWNTKADGTGVVFTATTQFPADAVDLTLYAQWTPDVYTIKFDTQVEGITTNPATKPVTFNAEVGALSVPAAREGYRFYGWNITPTGRNAEDTNNTSMYYDYTRFTIDSDTTLYAQWVTEVASFVLTYDPNAEGLPVPEPKVVKYNVQLGDYDYRVPVPVLDGKIFAGWFQEGVRDKIIATTMWATGGGNVTVTARWVDPLESTDPEEFDYFEDFENITMTSASRLHTLSRDGQVIGFIREGGAADASAIELDRTAGNLNFAVGGNGRRDGWFAMSDTIYFDGNGNLLVEFDYWKERAYAGGPEAQIWFLAKDSTTVFTMHNFTGNNTGIGVSVMPKQIYLPGSGNRGTMDGGPLYTNAAETSRGQLADVGNEQWYHVRVYIFANDNQLKFIIWNDSYYGELYLELPEGYAAKNVCYIYAQALRTGGVNWSDRIDNLGIKGNIINESQEYLIQFDTNIPAGAPTIQIPNSMPIKHGETVGVLPLVVRTDGYRFDAWYTERDGAGVKFVANETVFLYESNITLYANWILSHQWLTFDTQDPEVPAPANKSVLQGEPVYGGLFQTTPLPTVTRTGYDFDGWYTAATGGTKVENSTIYWSNSDETVYARWIAKKYWLSFDPNTTGVGAPNDKEVTFDQPVGTLPELVHPYDYIFKGWFTERGGAGTKYTAETVYRVDGDMKVYALWEEVEPITNVSEVIWPNLNVYPNPASDLVSISGLEGGELISIFDLSGRLVLNIKATSEKEEVSVSNLPAGTYFVRITKDNAEKTVKLLVE